MCPHVIVQATLQWRDEIDRLNVCSECCVEHRPCAVLASPLVPRVWDLLTVHLAVLGLHCAEAHGLGFSVLVCVFSACSGLKPMALWHVA